MERNIIMLQHEVFSFLQILYFYLYIIFIHVHTLNQNNFHSLLQ